MKVLKTNDYIISLENVRKVTRNISETKHTSRGTPYTLTHYQISIAYNNDTWGENIDCGTNSVGEKTCAELFQTIYEILSGD